MSISNRHQLSKFEDYFFFFVETKLVSSIFVGLKMYVIATTLKLGHNLYKKHLKILVKWLFFEANGPQDRVLSKTKKCGF